MKKNTKSIVKLTMGEKLLYTLGVFCTIFTIVLKVFSFVFQTIQKFFAIEKLGC